MMGKKVLVTGAHGFIGARLTQKLVELGYETHVLVRKGSDKGRLASVWDTLTVSETDLVDTDRVARFVKHINPEMIFHLAGSGVHTYFDTSTSAYREMMQSNIHGTVNLLEAAEKTGCTLFINTGSCYEYGSSRIPFVENAPLRPLNVYGATKAAATLIAHTFMRNNHTPVVTVRPFTVYGPDEDNRRFISSVVRKCLQGENPKLTKKTIYRDYIFIDDVVEGYIQIAQQKEKAVGEIINISTGIATSLQDAARIIIRCTSAHVTVDTGGYPTLPGEVEFLVGNPKKAEHMLSWKAKYTLLEGLKKTISWIRSVS